MLELDVRPVYERTERQTYVANYRMLGVSQIIFIDPRTQRVRSLLKSGNDYEEMVVMEGQLTFNGVPGFSIDVAWLFADDKPDKFTVTKQLIQAADAAAIDTWQAS